MIKNGSFFPGRGTLLEQTYLAGKEAGITELKAQLARKNEAEAKVLGIATAVVKVLEMREFTVSDEVRERILGCHERQLLRYWLGEAFDVKSVEQLFVDDEV